MKYLAFLVVFFFSSELFSQQPCIPEPGGICLTKEEREKVVAAVKELDRIKNSPAEITIQDPIIIIRDWEDRIYVNGGENKPLKLKLKIADVIDRDLEMTVPIEVGFREKPPDPLFRFRLRAQIGLYFPEIIRTIKKTSDEVENPFEKFWTASLGFDFFHYEILNIAALLGVDGLGLSLGLDITKNFGIYTGPIVRYDGWKATLDTGVHFALW